MFVGVAVAEMLRVAVRLADTERDIDGDPVIVRLSLGATYEYRGLSETEIDGVDVADPDVLADAEELLLVEGDAVRVADVVGLADADVESVIVGEAVRDGETELEIDADAEVDGVVLAEAVGLGDGGAAHISVSLSSQMLNASWPARGCQFARRAVVDALHGNGHSAK